MGTYFNPDNRSNSLFQELGIGAPEPFAPICLMKTSGRKAAPPKRAKGLVARARLYMDRAYPEYRMSRQQERLMQAWDEQYPPDTTANQRAQI